jgi:hypothetical protein
VNHPPGENNGNIWDVYFGPLTVSPYDMTQSYWAGELVYVQDPNSQAVNVYRSLTNANGNPTTQTITYTTPTAGPNQVTASVSITGSGQANPWVLQEWNPLVTYDREQVVQYEFHIFRSATEQNHTNTPVLGGSVFWIDCGPLTTPTVALVSNTNWLPIPATVRSILMAYPIGAGPVQEATSRNAFRLPNGYLREAPQDPTQGAVSYLGAPGGLTYNDWQFEGKYLTSKMADTILLRFIADITHVQDMDDMFCEGLAARMAMEMCESLTQSTAKMASMAGSYRMTMGEARIVNAIESGSDQPPEDDYISCRA